MVRELFGADEEVLCHVTPYDDPMKLAELEASKPVRDERAANAVGKGDETSGRVDEPEACWELFRWYRANCVNPMLRGRLTRKQWEEMERDRKAIYSPERIEMWIVIRQVRRDRERMRDAMGGIGPVLCDRLVPGYAIGDPHYIRWEQDLVNAHG